MQNRFEDFDKLEALMEPLAKGIFEKKFKPNDDFIQKFPYIWIPASGKPVYDDITWPEMKQQHKWGYCKGNYMHPMISFLYIRPDVFKELISIGGPAALIKKGVLNIHYFVSRKKTVETFKETWKIAFGNLKTREIIESVNLVNERDLLINSVRSDDSRCGDRKGLRSLTLSITNSLIDFEASVANPKNKRSKLN